METSDLKPMVEALRDNIDELEMALAPLLQVNLTDISSKLPLMDKAKLSVLATYAIESILFSVLKLNGVDAKEHPVFRELTRVEQYFQKIKDAEAGGPEKRTTMRLDHQAANRFIKHALAGNERHDREREERLVRERASAQKKLDLMSSQSPKQSSQEKTKKRKAINDLNADSLGKGLVDIDSQVLSGSERTEATTNEAEALESEHDARSKQKRVKKEVRHRNHSAGKRKKSSKSPRDNHTVFEDLLNRRPGNLTTDANG